MTDDKKPTQVQEGELSFEDLANSSFSFSVNDFTPKPTPEINVTLEEQEEEEEEINTQQPTEEELAAQAAADAAASEEEEEEEQEEEEQPKPETIKAGTGEPSIMYNSIAKKYITDGIWEDVELEIEDGKKVKLSEIENLDEETFFHIQKEQKSFLDEEIEKNYIPVEGLDETGLKVVEILRNGGDFFELFQKPEDTKKPFEGVDLDNEKNQESILFQQYLRQGLSEGDAVDLVKKAKKELTIDTKVQQIVEHYQTSFDKMLTKKAEEQAAKKLEDDKKVKEFKKSVLDNLKNEYKLKDTLARKLTNLGVERTAEGEFKIDEIYSQKMEDPKEAADLLYFLSDKAGYLKMMGANVKRESNLKTIRTVTRLKEKAKTTTKEPTQKSELSFNVATN